MTRQPKYRTLLVGVFCVGLLSTACEKGSTPAGKVPEPGTTLVFVGRKPIDPRWDAIVAGARRHASLRPELSVKSVAPTYGEDVTLSDLFDRALKMSPSAVFVWVDDPADPEIPLDKLTSAGAVLIAVGSRLQAAGGVPYVNVDLPSGALEFGRRMQDALAGSKSYALLHNDGRDPLATSCYRSFLEGAGLCAEPRPIIERNAAKDPGTPQKLIEEMLAEFRHTGLVVTLDGDAWLGADAEPPLPPQTRFAALSTVQPLWRHLRSGKATMLVGPLDGEIGAAAVRAALAVLMADSSAPRVEIVECEVVTRDTLDDFAARYTKAIGGEVPETQPTTSHQPPTTP